MPSSGQERLGIGSALRHCCMPCVPRITGRVSLSLSASAGFLRKVYGILSVQFFLTTVITAITMFTPAAKLYISQKWVWPTLFPHITHCGYDWSNYGRVRAMAFHSFLLPTPHWWRRSHMHQILLQRLRGSGLAKRRVADETSVFLRVHEM